MGLFSGVIVLEAVELESVLTTDNPFILKDQAIISYTAIVGGVYTGMKMYVGPGNFNDLQPVFSVPAGGKQAKSIPGSAMPADNVYTYTLTTLDISSLGTSIGVTAFMINNADFKPDFIFSGNQGALIAGDTISFSGLPAKADVTTINFILI